MSCGLEYFYKKKIKKHFSPILKKLKKKGCFKKFLIWN